MSLIVELPFVFDRKVYGWGKAN